MISGGGSAALKSSYFISPYDGIVEALKEANPDVEVTYSEGARSTFNNFCCRVDTQPSPLLAYRTMPTLDYDILTEDGKPGWTCTWYTHESDSSMTPLPEPIKTQYVDETRIFIRYVCSSAFVTSFSLHFCSAPRILRRLLIAGRSSLTVA